MMNKEKMLRIGTAVLSPVVICLAVLQLLGVWENAILVFEPLMGIILLLQSVQYWDRDRKVAVLQLCAALFVLGVAVYILLF